ncbi:hypothetical protein [Halalkalicoccus salilacus]|uniref:hypothetical protein n=1 Tax=Halalkalicoccus sp. GCM10025704 TaxID=3252662 RepID=UPI00362357ED
MDVTTVVAAVLFLAGIALVVWSVEHFVEAVARSAVSLGVSGFFLAVVLAGVDLENAILGITAAYGDLSRSRSGRCSGRPSSSSRSPSASPASSCPSRRGCRGRTS